MYVTKLIHAVLCKDIEKAKELIRNGADVNETDERGDTALMHAARRNDVEFVNLLIDSGANLDLQGDFGNTALSWAALNKRFACVKLLISKGANTEKPWSIMGWAVEHGFPGILQLLLEKGETPNRLVAVPGGGATRTPLMIAAENGYLRCTELLLAHGADPNYQTPTGRNALTYAALYGHWDIFVLLLKVHIQQASTETEKKDLQLLLAAAQGDIDRVRHLLRNEGVSPNATSQGNITALMLAAVYGHVEVARLLLESGADVNAKIKWVLTTSLLEAAEHNQTAVAKLLLEQGADINAKDGRGSAFVIAAGKGNVELLSILLATRNTPRFIKKGRKILENNLDITLTNVSKQTALLLAVQNGHIDCVKFLLDNGFSLQDPAVRGPFALLVAAGCGHLEIAKLLLERGAPLNATGRVGRNALLIALYSHLVKKSNIEMIQFLLEKGIDIHAKGVEGTPLQKGLRNDDPEVRRIFEEWVKNHPQ